MKEKVYVLWSRKTHQCPKSDQDDEIFIARANGGSKYVSDRVSYSTIFSSTKEHRSTSAALVWTHSFAPSGRSAHRLWICKKGSGKINYETDREREKNRAPYLDVHLDMTAELKSPPGWYKWCFQKREPTKNRAWGHR